MQVKFFREAIFLKTLNWMKSVAYSLHYWYGLIIGILIPNPIFIFHIDWNTLIHLVEKSVPTSRPLKYRYVSLETNF